jgi:hypothetical protein
MRVVIVSSGMQNIDAPRPVAVHNMPGLVMNVGPAAHLTPPTAEEKPTHAPCGRLRQKATSFSNAFRLALGFGAPAKPTEVKHHLPQGFKIEEGQLLTKGGDPVRIVAHHPGHRHGHFHAHGGKRHSFLMRVHFALMSLGPWEGRAVAFVLGCGIGVLLRMFWVLAVLFVRTLKGPRSTEEHEYIVVDGDAEEIFVAPVHYTYPIEKVEIVEAAESK